MRRLAISGILFILCIIIAGLSQTATDPADFSGKWYSSADQSVYLFCEGLIHCDKNTVAISVSDTISGAYTCSKSSIFLFVVGMDGLEEEKELYLVHKDESSFLCEHEDGTGRMYFIRYNG